MRLLPRACVTGAALALAASLTAVVPSSTAVASPATTTAAKPAPVRARIVFDKNQQHPFASTLTWRVWKYLPKADGTGAWTLVEEKSWRAGSGLGGKKGHNSCVRNVGWLPNGTYRPRLIDDRHGHLIRGRTFALSNKKCSNGTERHLLFIHTEQDVHNKQCKDRKGDQACRWEFPKINDYRSNGCIKLSPTDLADLARRFHRYFKAGRTYPVQRFALRVIG